MMVSGGSEGFRRLAANRRGIRRTGTGMPSRGPANLDLLAETALRNGVEIWHHLIHDRRAISPELYARCAAALPAVRLRVNAKLLAERPKKRDDWPAFSEMTGNPIKRLPYSWRLWWTLLRLQARRSLR